MVPVTGFTARKNRDSRGVEVSSRAAEPWRSNPLFQLLLRALTGDNGLLLAPIPSHPLTLWAPFPEVTVVNTLSSQPSMRHDMEFIRLSLMEATVST